MIGRVLSLQVARVGVLAWRAKQVPSAIAKQPADGPVMLGPHGFDGDEHADPGNHGGLDMAVCVYPAEHMPGWEAWLGRELAPGAFGENLTTEGLLESEVHIGDVFALGGAIVQVSQPRGPCFKLAARHGAKELPGRMAKGLIAGFLLRVLEPGPVDAGDRIELIERRCAISVAEVLRVSYRDRRDDDAIAAVLAVAELAAQTADSLRSRQQRNVLPVQDFDTD